MVRVGGMVSWEKKWKLGKKGKEKRRKITLKKGKNAFKNASFWAINSKAGVKKINGNGGKEKK